MSHLFQSTIQRSNSSSRRALAIETGMCNGDGWDRPDNGEPHGQKACSRRLGVGKELPCSGLLHAEEAMAESWRE